MASYWTCRHASNHNLPLKVQAQIVKNNGNSPIYIYDIEDDLPLPDAYMKAFTVLIIDPGQELDISQTPYLKNSHYSYPDRDITIHCDVDIDVAIESSDLSNRWEQDNSHPWNGAKLVNGSYTEKHGKSHPALSFPMHSHMITNTWGLDEIPVTININDTLYSCNCDSLDLFRKGCTCGYVKPKKWGLGS